jgi:hypothetical protein
MSEKLLYYFTYIHINIDSNTIDSSATLAGNHIHAADVGRGFPAVRHVARTTLGRDTVDFRGSPFQAEESLKSIYISVKSPRISHLKIMSRVMSGTK